MRAVICHALGWPQRLLVESCAAPEARPGRVLVRVAAAGLNFADSLVLAGAYQEKVAPPFIPGAELAGTVIDAGGAPGFAVGDRVMGQVDTGAFAEFALADPRRLAKVPDAMPDDVAAGFFVRYGTAYCALAERAALRPGQRVLVLGASGGTGLAAVDVACALGAVSIGVARSEHKLDTVRTAGASVVIDSERSDMREAVMAATNGKGVDVVFDTVGGELTLSALRCLAFEGRLMVIGFTAGVPARIPANHVLVKNVDITGFYWGTYQDRDPAMTRRAFDALARLYERGRLHPHVADRVPLEDVGNALVRLLARRYAGKVIVTIDPSRNFAP